LSAGNCGIHGATAAERTRERAAVDVLELAADRNTVSDTARTQAVLARQSREKMRGRIALDGDARREDDFGEPVRDEPLLEQLQAKLRGSYAVDRREVPHEHEVFAAIRARLLDREQVCGRFDDAELRAVAPVARTESAHALLGEHSAPLAIANGLHGALERRCQASAALAIFVQ